MKFKEFRKQLYKWYDANKRVHPWKSHRDPYKIWLYEIIMQQTRIQQGLPYYERFIATYPTVKELAKAKVEHVLKLWEGLGYYSRARNLHETAKHVYSELGGKFPVTSKELMNLKGIGAYTGAAIATFAYDESIDVIDGNVIRVLSRFFGIYEAIDTKEGKKKIEQLSAQSLDLKNPARYNQAMMDFGALQCAPKSPNCLSCNLARLCEANINDDVSRIPLKKKKLIKKDRFFHYLSIKNNQRLLIRQRTKKDIWKLLYELPYIETTSNEAISKKHVGSWLNSEFNYTKAFRFTRLDANKKHVLTHQNIYGAFYTLEMKDELSLLPEEYLYCKREALSNEYAVPKLLDWFLHKKPISLFD